MIFYFAILLNILLLISVDLKHHSSATKVLCLPASNKKTGHLAFKHKDQPFFANSDRGVRVHPIHKQHAKCL